MQKTQNEEFLAVIIGKKLKKNMREPSELLIFQRQADEYGTIDQEKYTMTLHQNLHEIPDLRKVMSMQFYFKNTRFNQDPCSVIFAQRDCIIEFNFQTKETHKMCTFEVPLVRQPEFFTMNSDQSISIVASIANGIYFNHHTCD